MKRAGFLLGAFIAGAASVLLALYVALRTGPSVIMADDMLDALVASADAPLSRFPPHSVVYVKSSVGPLLLERLQPRYPSLRLMSYSTRPEEACSAEEPLRAPLSCERDDFVKLEVLSSPTHGTMLVAVATSKAVGESFLLKFRGRWRVFVDRWYVL